MDMQEYFKLLISDQELSTALNKQHYCFAHRMMPYIVENHFHDLVNKVINESAQSWILDLWNQSNEATQLSLSEYTALIHPKTHFVQASEELGVILIAMPTPRVSPEAAYAAVVFAFDQHYPPSQWLRGYFTLELGVDTSVHWTLGEWDSSGHINRGEFKYEPTVKNFLAVIVAEGESRWQRRVTSKP